MGYYPSKPKKSTKAQADALFAMEAIQNEGIISFADTAPLTHFEGNPYNAQHDAWAIQFSDAWQNNNASVGVRNSIMQHSRWQTKRHSYQELAHMANDDIIKSAIDTIAQECTGQWGQIVINELDDQDQAAEIINKLENRLQDLNIKELAKEAMQKALIYGGVGIFLNMGGNQDLEKDFDFNLRSVKANGLKSVKLIEPYLFAPMQVNTTNPIADDFMKPSVWHVSGIGAVSATRLKTMEIFSATDLVKPLYNFLGISIISFMFDKVRSADTIRQSLADIFLRFRTNIIKTPLVEQGEGHHLKAKIKGMQYGQNNLGVMVLTPQEEFIQTITPLSGLDKIQAQAYEAIASSARMPAIKLLGLTPSGFNATGEFDLLNYYDTISGYQNTILRKFLERILRILALEAGFDIAPEFKFTPLKKETKIEAAQTKIANADFVSKLTAEGIITQEQALLMLQEAEAVSKAVKFENEPDIDLGELGIETEQEQEANHSENA